MRKHRFPWMHKITATVLTGCLAAGALFVGSTVLHALTPTYAVYTQIHRMPVESEAIAEGVRYEKHRILTTEGWIVVHVLRSDLRVAKPTLLTADELTHRSTLRSMAAQESNVVAAINGDFFDVNSKAVLGQMIEQGEVLATSNGEWQFAHFSIPKGGQPRIHYNHAMNHTIHGQWDSMKLDFVNKMYFTGNRTIRFDEHFGAKSPARKGHLEALVVDGIVTEMRKDGRPFDLSADRYVLVSTGANIAAFERKFPVGTPIEIDLDQQIRSLDFSFSGGTRLVYKGKAADFTHNVLGFHPRTAVALNEARTEMMFVAVDGRTVSHRGVAQSELAQILIELGAHEALNLDGGGSTQMVTRSPFTASIDMANAPSDGTERWIYNGIAVKTANPNSGSRAVREIRLQPASQLLLVGAAVDLHPVASDHRYQPAKIEGQIQYQASGITGTFEGDRFVPTAAGVGRIIARYGNVVTEIPVRVESEAVRLEFDREDLRLEPGTETKIRVYAISKSGERFPLEPASLQAKMTTLTGVELSKAYDPKTGVIKAPSGAATGFLAFSYTVDGKKLSRSLRIRVGSERSLLADFEKPTAELATHPKAVVGNYLEIASAASHGKAGYLSFDFFDEAPTRAAYMRFLKPLTLPMHSYRITAQVFGDEGNGTWLRARLVGADGRGVNVDLARRVDWSGWKQVSAVVPADLAQPVKLEQIYAVETDPALEYSGYVMVDRVEAIYGEPMNYEVPREQHRVKATEDYKIEAAFAGTRRRFAYRTPETPKPEEKEEYEIKLKERFQGLLVLPELPKDDADKESMLRDMGDFHWLILNNRDGLLRSNDGVAQWKAILKLHSGASKPVVISFTHPNVFRDELEEDLFYQTFTRLVDDGIDVALIFPSAGEKFAIRHQHGLTVAEIPRAKPLDAGEPSGDRGSSGDSDASNAQGTSGEGEVSDENAVPVLELGIHKGRIQIEAVMPKAAASQASAPKESKQ